MVHRAIRHPSRGALSNPAPRFSAQQAEDFDDGWGTLETLTDPPPATRLHADYARRIISRNASPDISFEASINPYKGCSHGCIYCFARPTHEYLDLSAGRDFETEIFYKPDASALLEAELRAPNYRCTPITLGANTDPYQPDEKKLGITRALLEVAARFNQPVSIVTKGALVIRDRDLLAAMARRNLVRVSISLTSLDNTLKRSLEPRAASPARRLRAIAELHAAGVPVGALIAPVIPMITDAELERLVAAAAEAGADSASYILLRLPYGVKHLFREWLDAHYPQRAAHVMSLINQMRGGLDNDPNWGTRMTGTGVYAQLLARRFQLACRRTGLPKRRIALDTTRFAPTHAAEQQMRFAF